jgi:hypothetical protein
VVILVFHGASRLKRPSGPSTVNLNESQLEIEGLRQVVSSQGFPQRSSGNDAALLQQHRVRDAGWNLLYVMGNQDHGGGVLILRELAKGIDQRLAASQIKARGGLIEQQQFGICHEGASYLDPLPLTFAESAERAIGEALYV